MTWKDRWNRWKEGFGKSRAPWIFAGAAVLAVAVGAAVATNVEGSDPKAEPKAEATQEVGPPAERLEDVLRDEGRDPEERIEAALKLLEDEQRTAGRFPGDPFGTRWDSGSLLLGDPWDPLRELQEIQLNMDRMFNEVFSRVRTDETIASGAIAAGAPAWSPRGEFEENEDAYVYRFDLPGVEEGEVNVTVTEGQLIVEGRRQSRIERTEGDGGAVRREIQYGEFRRVLPVPADVDPTAAEVRTKLDEGVLTVTLPKAEAEE